MLLGGMVPRSGARWREDRRNRPLVASVAAVERRVAGSKVGPPDRAVLDPEALVRVLLEVDEGVGIPEAALATLFDPFTQVVYPQVRRRAGTGLGRAITRRLCWMMGGEIDVESVSGKGSTFTIWIPSVYRSLGSSESWRPLRNNGGPSRHSGPVPRVGL